MTIAETVLVFACIPLGLYVVVAVAVYGTASRQVPRYRPGRPFVFEPVWYVAARAPHHLDDPNTPALPPVDVPLALHSGLGGSGASSTRATGGARGSW